MCYNIFSLRNEFNLTERSRSPRKGRKNSLIEDDDVTDNFRFLLEHNRNDFKTATGSPIFNWQKSKSNMSDKNKYVNIL